MNTKDFYRHIRQNFDPILIPHGFTSEESNNCCYSREISPEVYHIICPSMLSGKSKYDINVFATSPIIQVDFLDSFPDELELVSFPNCYLSNERGVGRYAKQYFCKNPDAFINSFKRDVGPALENYAIPYLDSIRTFSDVIPTITNDFMMGAALLHVGRKAEAKAYIEREIARLSRLARDPLGEVERGLSFQRSLLDRL